MISNKKKAAIDAIAANEVLKEKFNYEVSELPFMCK